MNTLHEENMELIKRLGQYASGQIVLTKEEIEEMTNKIASNQKQMLSGLNPS